MLSLYPAPTTVTGPSDAPVNQERYPGIPPSSGCTISRQPEEPLVDMEKNPGANGGVNCVIA